MKKSVKKPGDAKVAGKPLPLKLQKPFKDLEQLMLDMMNQPIDLYEHPKVLTEPPAGAWIGILQDGKLKMTGFDSAGKSKYRPPHKPLKSLADMYKDDGDE